MSELLSVDFFYLQADEEEVVVGQALMIHAPRVGEHIRIMRPNGESWWQVTEVCYLVSDGANNGIQSRCIGAYCLVKPKE